MRIIDVSETSTVEGELLRHAFRGRLLKMTLLCKLLNGKYFFSLGANVIDHVGYSVMDSPFERVEIAIFDHDDISQM